MTNQLELPSKGGSLLMELRNKVLDDIVLRQYGFRYGALALRSVGQILWFWTAGISLPTKIGSQAMRTLGFFVAVEIANWVVTDKSEVNTDKQKNDIPNILPLYFRPLSVRAFLFEFFFQLIELYFQHSFSFQYRI